MYERAPTDGNHNEGCCGFPLNSVGTRVKHATNSANRDADPPTELAEKDLSEGTHDRYRRALRSLDGWLAGRPATDAALAGYLSALFDRGLAVATPGIVVAAVKDRAKREGASSPVGTLTNRALCAFRRNAAGRGPGQVVGISWEQADRMVELAEDRRSAAGLRDALLVRIMSDCLLRVGEASALDCSDIAFVGDWLEVVVRCSKTDQEGRGVALYAGPETARLARRWLKKAPIADGPLFRPVKKGGWVADTRLSDRSMRDIVKRRAADAGIEGRTSGHSLRIGAAQSLRDAGATTPELMMAGRWKRVETMARYTRTQDAAVGPVARLRYGVMPPERRMPQRHSTAARKTARASKRAQKEWRRTMRMAKKLRKNSCTAPNWRDSFLKSGFAEPILTACLV